MPWHVSISSVPLSTGVGSVPPALRSISTSTIAAGRSTACVPSNQPSPVGWFAQWPYGNSACCPAVVPNAAPVRPAPCAVMYTSEPHDPGDAVCDGVVPGVGVTAGVPVCVPVCVPVAGAVRVGVGVWLRVADTVAGDEPVEDHVGATVPPHAAAPLSRATVALTTTKPPSAVALSRPTASLTVKVSVFGPPSTRADGGSTIVTRGGVGGALHAHHSGGEYEPAKTPLRDTAMTSAAAHVRPGTSTAASAVTVSPGGVPSRHEKAAPACASQ